MVSMNLARVTATAGPPSPITRLAEPLLIEGALEPGLAESWSLAELDRQYGALPVFVALDGRPTPDRDGSRSNEIRTLADYVRWLERADSEPRYVMHTFFLEENRARVQTAVERCRRSGAFVPDLPFHDSAECMAKDLDFLEDYIREPQLFRFYLGPEGTGALPHRHELAVNALTHGTKRWVVYRSVTKAAAEVERAAHRDYGAGSLARDWFEEQAGSLAQRDGLEVWEFEQRAGDLLVIPGGLMHATLNLTPVTGLIAQELYW